MRNLKKISALILTFLTVLTMLTGCAGKETSENTDDSSDIVLKLSDNLPDFNIHGNYKEGETDIELDSGSEVLWPYDGDDNAEYRFARAYKWPVGELSLLDETKADALNFFPEQEPEVITCNFWNEPNDYEYTYYAGIKDNNLMVQVWTFMDGDYFYQICVGYDLVTYTVDGTDISYSIPKYMEESESGYALKSFVDPDFESDMSEFPNIDIYLNDGDYDYSPENIAESWNVENVEVEEHEFSSNDKNTKFPGYIISCEYTEDDGTTLVFRHYAIKFNDKYFAILFTYKKNLEFTDYIENSYRAFLYTITEK